MKLFLIIGTTLFFSSAWGDATSTGATKAASCAACHGPKGISANPLWPNLAGQKLDYMIKQLHDFKAGRRQDPLMTPMANTLSDQDMVEISKYFSSL